MCVQYRGEGKNEKYTENVNNGNEMRKLMSRILWLQKYIL